MIYMGLDRNEKRKCHLCDKFFTYTNYTRHCRTNLHRKLMSIKELLGGLSIKKYGVNV